MNAGPSTLPRGATLTLAGGGWVLALAALLGGAAALWALGPLVLRGTAAARGDGVHVESYGFDLSRCLVPRDALVAAGLPVDGLPALVEPATLAAGEAEALKLTARDLYLVPSDRVVGVAVGSDACAYPLRVLAWHDAVNHTLGGRPLVVSYGALSGSVGVFERRLDDRVLELGSSGLLASSIPLLYDRRPGEAESLWCQLTGRAVAGPLAGRSLPPVPAVLARWEDWRAAHPGTRVLAPVRGRTRLYLRDAYSTYAAGGVPRFPVSPPPPPGLAPLAPVVAVAVAGGRHVVYPVAWIRERARERAGEGGPTWRVEQDGVAIELTCRDDTVWARAVDGRALEVRYAAWFAWFATHQDDARLAGTP